MIFENFTVEAIKNVGSFIQETIHKICNQVFTDHNAPRQWTTNIIIPLPKKGELFSMTNYQGISLMSSAAKVYNRILLNRITPVVDPVLRHYQAGFRKGRGCAYQIHILRRIMESGTNKSPFLLHSLIFGKHSTLSIG